VIGIALLPATGSLSVLRALRVLRVMRLISMVPSMRRVASGLLAAIPGLGSVIGIILVILYVFSVMATKIFGGAFPQWFGTLGESFYTLFQVMTLESWSMGVVRPIMEVYPYAWVFFVLFILISTFTMLNLFIAVVVNAMHAEHQREVEQARVEGDAGRDLLQEVGALRSELRLVHAMLERQNAGRETEQGR
jgi:voltage-gated sodium channel